MATAANKAAEVAKETSAKTNAETSTNALEVIAKVEVFYRAGREWSQTPRTVLLADLSEQEITDLKAESMLIVREVETAA